MLDRYSIKHSLGSSVWLATDNRLGKEVVLSVHENLKQVPSLSHPNVLPIIDHGMTDGKIYTVADVVETSLEKEIQKGLSYPEIVNYMQQTLSGLEYAHAKGVLHTGLDPSKILIDDHRVKISGFGVRTHKPEYTAPEVLGGAPFSAATDTYAVALLFYEAITGATPFRGETEAAIVSQQLYSEPPRPSAANSRLRRDDDIKDYRVVDSVAQRALAKDPSKRYPDAAALRSAIVSSRFDKQKNRKPLWIVLVVCLLSVIAGAVLFKDDSVDIPDYRGEKIAFATEQIESKGWEYEIQEQTSRLREGTVLNQDPIGRTEPPVRVVLTVAKKELRMPALVGTTQEAAEARLEELGIDYDIVTKYLRAPMGTVVGTVPAQDTILSEGDRVQLIVSVGVRTVVVPNVIGLTEAAAEQQLKAVGLDYRIVSGLSGYVVRQTTGRIPITEKVDIELEATPDLIGLSETDATDLLLKRGISYTIYEEPTDNPGMDGIVIAQVPDPGDEIQNMEITVGRWGE